MCETVHVAIAAEARFVKYLPTLLFSIVASSRSASCITIHFFCRSDPIGERGRLVARNLGLRLNVHPVQDKFFLLKNTSESAAMNLVRFYLPELLPSVSKVLWLDVDVIINSDVVGLMKTLFVKENIFVPVAAVPRNKELRHFSAYLASHISDEALSGDAFNAGIFALNLRVWRARNITKKVESVVAFLEKYDIQSYKGMSFRGVSSQTPLNILFGTGFQRIDSCWNVIGLGASRYWLAKRIVFAWAGGVAKACALHWSGKAKPWNDNAFADVYGPVADAAARGGFAEIVPSFS